MGSLTDVVQSIWTATSASTSYPRLEGTVKVDVAVVGAGITGITTALFLARDGAAVALLEADRVASSTTGNTTAKLTSLHGLTYTSIAGEQGEEPAQLYGRANEAAIAQVAELSQAHGIACDFERMPAFTYTEEPDQIAQIEAEVTVAQRLGLPATFVTETDLPFPVAAAVRFDNQAMFHPRKYCLGLAEVLAKQGVRIFERTAVTGIEEGKPSVLTAAAGTVVADHVVQATQLPFHDPFGFFTSNFPNQSYGLAFATSEGVPEGMYLSASPPTRSIRPYRDGRQSYLIIGGEGHKMARDADTNQRYETLVRWAQERFGTGKPAFAWSAHDYLPVDGIPYVGRLTPDTDRLWVATGFKKWGLTNGTAAAMILADSIAGRENPWARTFDSLRLKPKPVEKWLKRQAELKKSHAEGSIETVTAQLELVLGPREGRVIDTTQKQKVAAYRDEDGRLHTHSAVCSHMGCQVAFNPAEKTWDCPCHGSRFDITGTPIHGPATHSLKPVRLDPEAAASAT
ncbi:MAG TPA: FAD-dependent oxidoreductase, partial [Actinomycetota bacterium]|nr:FAD-dependent oxidoreductase [Actinomycetota bacterium]